MLRSRCGGSALRVHELRPAAFLRWPTATPSRQTCICYEFAQVREQAVHEIWLAPQCTVSRCRSVDRAYLYCSLRLQGQSLCTAQEVLDLPVLHLSAFNVWRESLPDLEHQGVQLVFVLSPSSCPVFVAQSYQ